MTNRWDVEDWKVAGFIFVHINRYFIVANMAKENLKDKLDGNELDLSLSSLEAVPVKEIVSNMVVHVCSC